MVPNLICDPDFFGPHKICALRNLGPKKFGPQEIWAPHESCHSFFKRGLLGA